LEEGRKSLRQAVKLLTEQADKLQAENVSLKKGKSFNFFFKESDLLW